MLIGTDGGQILALDTTQLDDLRTGPGGGASSAAALSGPAPFADLHGPIARIALTDDASGMAVKVGADELVVVDPGTGDERARVRLPGLYDIADRGSFGQSLTADPAAVADRPPPRRP